MAILVPARTELHKKAEILSAPETFNVNTFLQMLKLFSFQFFFLVLLARCCMLPKSILNSVRWCQIAARTKTERNTNSKAPSMKERCTIACIFSSLCNWRKNKEPSEEIIESCAVLQEHITSFLLASFNDGSRSIYFPPFLLNNLSLR